MKLYLKDIIEAVGRAMTGYPGFTNKHNVLAERIGEDAGNFSKIVNGKRGLSEEKLARLHRALLLENLGIPFDPSWWTTRPMEDLAAAIADARGGDPLEMLAGNLEPEAFFGFAREIGGARIVPGMEASPVWAHIRNTPVIARERLRLRVTPPMDGFLKLLVIESGRVSAMDEFFGLCRLRLAGGEEKTLTHSFPVSPASPEALFVGLMQAERFAADLPWTLDPAQAIAPPRLAEWLRERLASGPELRIAALRLFLSEGEA